MSFVDSKFWKWWIIYGKHIEAFLIIFLFLIIIWAYNHNSEVQEKISEKCGWGEEDYQCYCEKGKAMEIKNLIENKGMDIYQYNNA